MYRVRNIAIGVIVLLLSLCLMGYILAQRGASAPEASYTGLPFRLKHVAEYPVSLPPGDLLFKDERYLLLLSSLTLERPPREVVAFSLADKKVAWRLELAGSPVQALRVGDGFLVVTIPQKEAGATHLSLISQDGRLMWSVDVGEGLAALAQDATGRVWIATDKGLSLVDVTDGSIVAPAVKWPADAPRSEWRQLATYVSDDGVHLVASTGPRVVSYRENGEEWKIEWQFQSSGKVLALYPLAEKVAGSRLVVLAHSAAYGLDAKGQPVWKVQNSDFNLDPLVVTCGKPLSRCVAFRNVLGRVYVVDSSATVHEWRLPGGNARLWIIPLPFPKHLALGMDAADLDGDGTEELVVRSLSSLFVYKPDGTLVSTTLLPDTEDEQKFVVRLRSAPRYPPVVHGSHILVATTKGLVEMELDEGGEP